MVPEISLRSVSQTVRVDIHKLDHLKRLMHALAHQEHEEEDKPPQAAALAD